MTTADYPRYRRRRFPLFFVLLLVIVLYSDKTTVTAVASASEDSSSSSIISRFRQYLQINTAQPKPNYQEAAGFLISRANYLSLESQVLEFVQGKPLVLLKWPDKDLTSILVNSHADVVHSEDHKWAHPPFDAHIDYASGNIYARGSQDMKCVGMQYLEAIRKLKSSSVGFQQPLRTVYLSFFLTRRLAAAMAPRSLLIPTSSRK